MPPKLPPELIDQTIGHLRSDQATLQACSLVSHAWLPASRHHLFHQIKLYTGGDKIVEFRKFLEGTPQIPGAICSLSLRCNETSSPYTSSTINADAICVHDLATLLSRLPSLKNLEVNHSHIECRCVPRPREVGDFRMERVAIRIGTMARIEDVVEIMSLFSSTGRLELACLRPLMEVAEPPHSSLQNLEKNFLQVESLKLLYLDGRLLTEILSRGLFSTAALTCVDISCNEMDQVRSLGILIREIGPQLLEFSFDPEGLATRNPPGAVNSHRVDLSH